jgi:CRISPR-associated endonuclease/helicase Cas3
MEAWEALLDSWGMPMELVVPARSPDDWIARANNQPEWILWGKAQPTDDGCPAHPLLFHMLDVASVAGLLLCSRVSPSLRRLLLSIHKDEATALRLVLFVIALHDLGKAGPAFQSKVEWARAALPKLGFDVAVVRDLKHHGDLGFGFVVPVLQQRGVPREAAVALARAVTGHHGELPSDPHLRALSAADRGKALRWQLARDGIVAGLAKLFSVDTAIGELRIDRGAIVALAGLCSMADWIGSMAEVFEYQPPGEPLAAYWTRALGRARAALDAVGVRPLSESSESEPSFAGLFPGYSPWPLHAQAEAVGRALDGPSLVVIEAPMGEGKTEAALLLASAAERRALSHGLYIGLPTQATANQMFGRVRRFLERTRPSERSNLQLVHGEADLVDAFRRIIAVYGGTKDERFAVGAERWFLRKKRALLAEFGVGTIDQALLGVMLVLHNFVRLFGLAGKTVVLDEVHAYDTYTSTILERMIEWLAAMKCTVVLLSATLPSKRRAALVAAFRLGAGATDDGRSAAVAAYPRITVATRERCHVRSFVARSKGVSLALEHVDPEPEAVAALLLREIEQGGCVGCICNTVERAQRVYEALGSAPDVQRLLLHARLLPEDRANREQTLERWLGPEGDGRTRPAKCIVVGTQVLEQSLDIDFDLLVSDLCPIDLLLQRAGRLHRHQRSDRSANRAHPRLVIARPVGSAAEVSLDRVAKVYAEAIVRQSLRVLEGREQIKVPTEIEELVEAVYLSLPPAGDDALFGSFVDWFGGQCAQRQDAEVRLMPGPAQEDDPFANLRVRAEDDGDPALHPMLRAETRSGPPSVEIVCLVRRGGALFADEAGTTPVDLGREPDAATTRALVRRSIGVSRPSLVRFLVSKDAAAASHVPESWQKSGLLKYRRCVVFADGAAVVANTRLTLDRELGLQLTRA